MKKVLVMGFPLGGFKSKENISEEKTLLESWKILSSDKSENCKECDFEGQCKLKKDFIVGSNKSILIKDVKYKRNDECFECINKNGVFEIDCLNCKRNVEREDKINHNLLYTINNAHMVENSSQAIPMMKLGIYNGELVKYFVPDMMQEGDENNPYFAYIYDYKKDSIYAIKELEGLSESFCDVIECNESGHSIHDITIATRNGIMFEVECSTYIKALKKMGEDTSSIKKDDFCFLLYPLMFSSDNYEPMICNTKLFFSDFQIVTESAQFTEFLKKIIDVNENKQKENLTEYFSYDEVMSELFKAENIGKLVYARKSDINTRFTSVAFPIKGSVVIKYKSHQKFEETMELWKASTEEEEAKDYVLVKA